jgi:hypothetical protein
MTRCELPLDLKAYNKKEDAHQEIVNYLENRKIDHIPISAEA